MIPIRFPHPALMALLLSIPVWADGKPEAAPPAAEAKAAAAPAAREEYDALFSQILKGLPQDKKALVDSAQGAKAKSGETPMAADPQALKDAAAAKRSQALKDLPPDVKARVDKAITDLDNRRKAKEAEFKELNQ
jgi:hypothetical protein